MKRPVTAASSWLLKIRICVLRSFSAGIAPLATLAASWLAWARKPSAGRREDLLPAGGDGHDEQPRSGTQVIHMDRARCT